MSAGACWRFGPRDADGLLQPSAFPWGVDAFAEGLPTAPIGANQPRFEEALGRLLARAWIVIALDYVPECGQAPAEVATDLVADAQFVTPPEALTADERWRWERVTHGAMIELAEFVLAGLGGGCAQALCGCVCSGV